MSDSDKELFQWTQESSGGIMQLRDGSAHTRAISERYVQSGRPGRIFSKGFRRWLVIGALAILATIFQHLAMRNLFAASLTVSETTALVALRPIKAGMAISVDDFSLQKVSAQRCFSETFSDGALLVGLGPATDVAEGQPIFRSGTKALESRRSLLAGIPQGKRLFSVLMSEGGMAKALRRGDRVDVVGNLNLPGKGFVTRNLLADASVAGLERDASGNNVFFFVTPTDVEFLTHAQRYGQLGIVLRNPYDSGGNVSDGMTQSRFLDDARIRDVYETDLFQIKKG
jgi:Flp pilus assembly protein CpaB